LYLAGALLAYYLFMKMNGGSILESFRPVRHDKGLGHHHHHHHLHHEGTPIPDAAGTQDIYAPAFPA
jgi:hypothetical protein